MRTFTKFIIILIIILTIMHYRKYRDFSDNYDIDQQELEYIDGNNLYNQLSPLIITFIEEKSLLKNINSYKLYSPLSVSIKSFEHLPTNNYLSHSGELLFIRPQSDITIELVSPKYKNSYKPITCKDSSLRHYHLPKSENEKVKAIDIIVHEYNIMFIPRHWLFKISNGDKKIEMYTSQNIYTYLFNILH